MWVAIMQNADPALVVRLDRQLTGSDDSCAPVVQARGGHAVHGGLRHAAAHRHARVQQVAPQHLENRRRPV